jgi:excisionase family DNA binding protein
LLSGETVDLGELDSREQAFLDDLACMGKSGVSYFEVYRLAIGPGSPALRGRTRLNRRILKSPLYLAARDIATRVGIEQGLILAPEHEAERGTAREDFSMVSVTQAAELIGVTRAAVYKAIQAGKLGARKIGNVTVVDKASVIKLIERRAQNDVDAQESSSPTGGSGSELSPSSTMVAKPR